MDELKAALDDVHGMYQEGLITKPEFLAKVGDIAYQWICKESTPMAVEPEPEMNLSF